MALRPASVLGLCAGAGGLELGIHLAVPAARTVCYVEREAAAAASLVASMEAGWFHPAPVWSDLLTFDARPWRGLVHILASGDPCQDNSVAGNRAGAAGERFLAPEVVRIAGECRPDLIFRENVPGNAGEQLSAIVPPLERMGYRVAAGIFSSAETGNTMRRERLFIMAHRDGSEPPAIAGDNGEVRGVPEAEREPGHGAAVSGGGRTDSLGAMGRTASPRPLPGPLAGANSSDEGRGPRDAEPQRRGGDVASAERRIEAGWIAASGEAAGGRSLGQSGGPGGALGRPSSSELQGQQPGQHLSERRQVKGRSASLSGGAILPPAVIPGPTDSRWIDVLARWPELQPALSQEEAESHLRRGVDAMANRIERLRATGNGVDPVAAAYAFLRLSARLAEARGSSGTVLMEAA